MIADEENERIIKKAIEKVELALHNLIHSPIPDEENKKFVRRFKIEAFHEILDELEKELPDKQIFRLRK